MEKTVKDHLIDIFDDLENKKLKRFKDKLRDRREGGPRVHLEATEKIEYSFELADLMINTFTTKNAPGVTIDILRAIGCNQQAEDLIKAIGQYSQVAQHVAQPVTQPAEVISEPSQSVQKTDDSLSDDFQISLQLTTCSQEFKDKILKEEGEEVYKPLDKSKRKRLALLINNISFDDKSMHRYGAEKDEENMEWLLQQLDYEVVKHKNLSGMEIENAIRTFAQREEHANSDSTFVVIMSHGNKDIILGVHYDRKRDVSTNDTFLVDKIYTNLNNLNSKALRDKPKVILIQACRGGEDGGMWVNDGKSENPLELQSDYVIPKETEFASLMSCTPGTVSWRNYLHGSRSIRYLVDVFEKYAHEDHIEELFRKVMRRFVTDEQRRGNYNQMACKERTTLTKHFYLFPGL